MSKVDDLIEALAESIQEKIKAGTCFEENIAAQTRALAELVSARAQEAPIDWKKLVKAKEEFEKITGRPF